MTFKNSIDCINDSIVEVISHFIKIESHGTSYKALCPFHQEKTPSFSVSESKGIFKCFGCGKNGDAIAFIEEHEKVEFKEALTIGASILNLQAEWETGQEGFNVEAFKYDESLKIINAKVALFYQQCLRQSPTATEYIRNRNFEVADKPDDKPEDDPLMLGYAPPGNELIKWARENQINLALMKELGLIATNKDTGEEYDFFRDRIMFPVCEKGGKITGFSGRSLHEKKGMPKYLNSPESKIYHKGKEFFALNVARRAIKSENRAYLVEGNFDVKRLHAIGVFNVVATCGTALTTDQVMLLMQYSMNVTLIYDGDDAGHKAIECNGKLLV
ncbi:MAG TPA: DNA primase, partial [Anaerovoracaceae bacterium]|nr:DNA primase [Anaerovoracaceae bacterium]